MEIEEKAEYVEVTIEKENALDKAKEAGKKIAEGFAKAKRKVGDRFYQHQENMAFYEGTQYELSRYKIARPWVVRMRTPYASVAIDTRVASLTASDYRGKLLPYNPEDVDAIRMLDDFKNDEWERMNLDVKIDEAIKMSAIVREAYLHVRLVGNGSKSKMEADIIDMPSSVYIDPTALSLKDAREAYVVSRISEYEAQELYPEFAWYFSDRASKYTPEARGEVYFNNDYNTEQEDALTMIVCYKKREGTITKYTTIEDILVDEKKLDGLTRFPIAQMRWKKAAGSPYGLALMDDLREIQKAINAIESAVTNTAVAYSAPSYGVRKGSGVDPKQLALAIGDPGMIVTVDGDPKASIVPLNLPQLDAAIVSVKEGYVGAIDRISGITSTYLGSIGTTGNTASGAKMAMERARIIEGDVLRNIEEFAEEITHILVEFIIAVYQGESVTSRKIDKATGQIEFLNREIPTGIDNLEYSFYVNLDKRTPYSQERDKELLLELYQMQHQYRDKVKLINQLDLVSSYDLSNKDELVKRFKDMSLKSDEETAQVITQLVTLANQTGVNPEAVQQAIQELLGDSDETPITDQLMQQMQQQAQEQSMMREQQMQQFQQEMTAAGVPGAQLQAAQSQVTGKPL